MTSSSSAPAPAVARWLGTWLPFPSIGAVNPALTAMANALRVGDHLLARLK